MQRNFLHNRSLQCSMYTCNPNDLIFTISKLLEQITPLQSCTILIPENPLFMVYTEMKIICTDTDKDGK